MNRKKYVLIMVVLILALGLTGCMRQANRVSRNLSQEADNFNVYRKVSVINQRTDTLLFTISGNFSVKQSEGDVDIIGEDDLGRYYKHFIHLSDEITYIVEDLGSTGVNKYKYEINFNPNMSIPVEPVYID